MKFSKLIYVLSLFFVFNVYADTSYQEVEFVRCVDGDTAVFKVDEEEVKFRFLAIDTPETVHPTKDVEAYGKDASEYTCNKLTNASSIVVEYENSNKTDKYGRSLAWIWVDGSLLQEELIDAGYAEVAYIYGTYKYTESLCLVQQDAKSNNLGIWYDGSREEGYCTTIDITNTVNNIEFDIDNTEDEDDEEEKLNNTLEKLDNIDTTINNLSDLLKSEKSEKIIIYIVIGISAISMIIKSKTGK